MNIYKARNSNEIVGTINDLQNENDLIQFCVDNRFHLTLRLILRYKNKKFQAVCKPELKSRTESNHWEYDATTNTAKRIITPPPNLLMLNIISKRKIYYPYKHIVAYGETPAEAMLELAKKINEIGVYYP